MVLTWYLDHYLNSKEQYDGVEKFNDGVMSVNDGVIINFAVYIQYGPNQKPDFASKVYDSHFLINKNIIIFFNSLLFLINKNKNN